MSADDTTDSEDHGTESDAGEERTPRERIEEGRDRAVEGFDQGLVDLLSWVLDTETRAKIYVFLQKRPGSTSEEIAQGTGLYPSTVREALAALHEEEVVHREKRQSKGAGNNPYEYTAIPPSELVSGIVGQVQEELNTVFNLDKMLDREGHEADDERTSEPVTITVEEVDDGDDEADESDAESDDAGASDDGSTSAE
ncbi:helix-turn-helix domain-containing protein [Haloarchaeobius amylolyticus]|uniref:helix-turn-helix domain-containing protein n=1 Tax=Haloarchaeobius amylolyticus TaxID=1198296 RepID=UPI002271609F|nr:helix-turn-helix domain-containing protein [Haloarchaeobius amylolyticus]